MTARCNLRCPYCYSATFSGRGELTFEEARRLIEGAAELRTQQFAFTGGEPLLRSDLFELLRYAVELGLTPHIVTNGILLSESAAQQLARLDIYTIVSVDGASPATHERMRGEGTWKRVHEGIQRLRKAGVEFCTVMTITSYNYGEAAPYLCHAMELGATHAAYIPAIPSGRALRNTWLLPSSDQVLKAAYAIQEAAEETGYYAAIWCSPFLNAFISSDRVFVGGCGRDGLDIDPEGNVLLCDVLDIRITSIRDRSVVDAWREFLAHPLVNELEAPSRLQAPCRTCPHRDSCGGGCVARSLFAFNNLFGPDPLCPIVAEWLQRRSSAEQRNA